MPAPISHHHRHTGNPLSPSPEPDDRADIVSLPRVHLSSEDENDIADIHRALTEAHGDDHQLYSEPHSSLDKFLEAEFRAGKKKSGLGVCFKSLSTWGEGNDHADVKTLGTALWRTLTFQDVYEWTIKPWMSKKDPESGRQLIRDFSGVARNGEIML